MLMVALVLGGITGQAFVFRGSPVAITWVQEGSFSEDGPGRSGVSASMYTMDGVTHVSTSHLHTTPTFIRLFLCGRRMASR